MPDQSFSPLWRFVSSENGQVSSDWIVLTSFLIFTAILVFSYLSRPTAALAESAASGMQDSHTIFFPDGISRGKSQSSSSGNGTALASPVAVTD
jgi:hypothetical protein